VTGEKSARDPESAPQPQRYFYCYSLPLEVGSVIRPGNWGRILNAYTPQTSPNAWNLVRELAFEIVRVRSFPQKPCRLEAIFVCMSETDLSEFRVRTGRNLDLGYEVELVDPHAASHIADWTLANVQNTDDLRALVDRATLYWQGANIVHRELLTVSPIRITRILK
jgi:hypothetical protein